MEDSTGRDAITSFISVSSNDASSSRIDKSEMSPFNRLLVDADRIKKEVKQLQKKRFSFSHDSCDGIQNENKGISSSFSGIISEVRKLQKERFNHKDAVSNSVRIVEIVAIEDEDEQLQQRFSKNEDKVRLFNDVMKSAKSFKAALPLDKIRTTTSECVENVQRPSLLNNVESVIPEFKSNKDYDVERLRRSNCEETLKIQPDDTSLINYRSPLSKRRKTGKVDSTNVNKSPISQSITKSNVSLPLEITQIEYNKHMNPPCSFKIERHQKLQSEKSVAEVSGERCKKDSTSKSITDKQDVHLQDLGMDTNKKRHSLSNTIEFLINRHRDQQRCVTSNENNTVMDLSLNTNRDTFSNKECISEIEVKKKKVPCITSESRESKQNTTVLDRNSLNVKDKSFDQESLTKVPVSSNLAATIQNKDHLIQTFKLKGSKKFAKICSNNDIERYLSILCSGGNISVSRRTSLNNDQCPTNQDTCTITEIVNKELKLTSMVTSPDRLTNCHIPSEVSVSLVQSPTDKGSVQHGSKIYGSTTSATQVKSVLINRETDISPSITREANKKEIESVQTNILVPSCDVQETKHNTTCKSQKNIVTTVQNVEAKPSYTSLTHSEISVMAIRQSCSPLEINITEELDVPTGLKQHVPLIDLSESTVMPCGKETNDGTVESKLIKCSQLTSASHSGENKTVSERPEITHTSVPSVSSLSQNLPSTSSMDSESQNFKLSYSVSQNPNKFSPKGKVNGFDILMGRQKTPQKKTPSKRLGKNSPVKLMLKNKSPKNFKYRSASPNKSSPFKKLNFDETNGKHTPQSRQATESENSPFIAYSNEFVTYFECILDNILKDNEMSVIIQKESEDIIAFKNLEDFQSKKLYIRMLGRKYTWHRVSDIKYDDIGIDDINSAFSYLEAFGFVTSDYNSEKVEVLLQMLKKPELQSLCKIFRIQPISLPKQKLIDALLNYRHQPTVFGSSNSSSLLSNRLRENLRYCIKLCEDKRQSFLRVVLLFSLSHQDIDEDREVSRQLIMLHYVKTNRVQFPSFAILKTIPVFSTKEELNCFEEANELLAELTKATDAKNWCDAQKCGEKASAQLEKVLNDSFISSRAAELPLFLRRFTGGSTYAYVMHRAIEACKKRKESIPFGVNMLVQLLGQNIYLPQYRGNWYEQLALLQQQHFKNPVQAAETVIVAMNDDHLNEVQQQVISGRGSMLLSRKKQINIPLKLRLEDSIKEPLVEPPNITIKAKALQTTAPGYKKIYIQEETEEVTYSSVEEYVVSHYKSRGYTEGVHAEGSIIITLFGLIFWDIIYEYPVPDVFRSQYQREPLDLCSGEFYKNRKEAIDKRLIDLCNWEMDYLKNHILGILQCHEGQESLVNWQRFKNLNQIMSFIECVGVEVLSRILERVVKSFRSVRKGFPDLAVWNPNKKECKFVEVKGPNDRLSIPQKLWLNYLTKCNIQCAEVCYVETTGSKQIQRSKRARPICEDDL